ncbi:hypothetical protein KGQ64_04935 [bacterium]|nr:hypothetical protein [bacterium]
MDRLRLALLGTALAVATFATPAWAAPARRAGGRVPTSPRSGSTAVGTLVPGSHPVEGGSSLLAPAQGGLQQAVERLGWRVEEFARGETPPPWAAGIGSSLDQRMERLLEMQERMAARIETPVPRLDEPIVLFTVAAATGLLGFLLGRSVQRRRDRRESSFRL